MNKVLYPRGQDLFLEKRILDYLAIETYLNLEYKGSFQMLIILDCIDS